MKKVVVVTGACGLLGRSFTRSLLTNGYYPILADINSDALERFTNELKNEFPNNSFMPFIIDINSKSSIENALASIIASHDSVFALVNNAYPRNKNYGRVFEKVEYTDFCENINLNLGGYFLTSQIFLNQFVLQGFGKIITIASIYGVIPPKFEVYANTNMTTPIEYAVIKSALIHLTKYLAKYYKKKNIQINSISPGGILDNQAADFIDRYNSNCLSKGMLNPKDISGALLFLLSNENDYINGQNIVVDDGFTL